MFDNVDQHKPLDRKVYDPATKRVIYNVQFCSPNCQYLTPKEEDNHNVKEHHTCLKYKTRVLHLGYKPNIVRVDECDEKNIIY